MKRLRTTCIAGAVAVLAGCSGDTAIHDATTVDTVAAAMPGKADTTSMATVSDSSIQDVVTLTLHAIGETPGDMRYDKDTLEAGAGAFVKLQLINQAQTMPMVHNIVFTSPGKYEAVAVAAEKIGASGNYIPEGTAVIAASPMALPGQTIDLEFTAPMMPGTYEFVCTYPGHWQRMHGKLIVK